jgi:hypothetical protein
MRVIPIVFPCGCECTRDFVDGVSVISTKHCEPHELAEEDAITVDECSYLGCDCPACEFGRFAHARETLPEQVDAENWKFLARLAARRRKAATA